MNSVVKNILGIVIAGAIVGNVSILFQFGERLSRIEAQIQNIAAMQNYTITKK